MSPSTSLVFEQNWRSAQEYHYTTELTKEQWAWQFLRRHPEYQRDWQCFITRWQALEQDYGVAPHRDFPRWKKDPRASVAEYDTEAICVDGFEDLGVMDGCNDNEDSLFIECWMGAKWGFYKFPQNPATFSPDIPQDLLWREQEIDLDDIAQRALLNNTKGKVDNRMAIYFDLNMPLKEQLLKAKQKLLRERRALQHQGLLKHRLCDYVAEWTLLLRYLDALSCGESMVTIEAELLREEMSISMEELVREAANMLNRGYLALLVAH